MSESDSGRGGGGKNDGATDHSVPGCDSLTAGRRGHSRRGFLSRTMLVVGTGSIAGLAGCSAADFDTDEPIPVVVNATPNPELDEFDVERTVTITILVANHGAPGEVQLVAQALAGDRAEPLNTATTTLDMDASSQTELIMELTVDGAADRIEVDATPVTD